MRPHVVRWWYSEVCEQWSGEVASGAHCCPETGRSTESPSPKDLMASPLQRLSSWASRWMDSCLLADWGSRCFNTANAKRQELSTGRAGSGRGVARVKCGLGAGGELRVHRWSSACCTVTGRKLCECDVESEGFAMSPCPLEFLLLWNRLAPS